MKIASLNPLKCANTALPCNVLLLVKIIALTWLLQGHMDKTPEIFLPFFPVFDRLAEMFGASLIRTLVQAAFLISLTLLCFNIRVRTCSFLLGFLIIFALLSSQNGYKNAKFFCACVFILAGVQESDDPWLLKWQISLVYFGAGVNKLLTADWTTGQFFAHRIRDWLPLLPGYFPFPLDFSWVPPMLAGQGLGWSVILIEFLLAFALLTKRFCVPAVWIGILFHSISVIMLRSAFGIFLVAILAAYMIFFVWPKEIRVTYGSACPKQGVLRRILEPFDFDRLLVWNPQPEPGTPLGAEIAGCRYSGFAALQKMLLYLPVSYFVMMLGLIYLPGTFRILAALTVAGFFSPILSGFLARAKSAQ